MQRPPAGRHDGRTQLVWAPLVATCQIDGGRPQLLLLYIVDLEGDYFDAELLRRIARDVDVRLTVSRACPRLAEIQRVFEGPQNPWLLRTVDDI